MPQPNAKDYAETIRQERNKHWIAANTENGARAFAAQYGTVARSRWAGPGNYRSDVYIIEVETA